VDVKSFKGEVASWKQSKINIAINDFCIITLIGLANTIEVIKISFTILPA
jgi:hypothetical protein